MINYWTRLKQGLVKSADVPVSVVIHELSDDLATEYRLEISMADCDVKLSYEDGTLIESDQFDKVVTKPVIIVNAIIDDNSVVTSGNLMAEFTILVNLKNAGRFYLDAYTQLCQVLLNPDDFGGYWQQFGLLPIQHKVTEPVDGRAIDPDLAGRVIFRSVLARFALLGELYGAG